MSVQFRPGRANEGEDRCIVSCVTDPGMTAYMAGLERLKQRLGEVGYDGAWMLWSGMYPPGSPRHSEVPYGFKISAFDCAREAGFKRVVWLDAEAFPVRPLDLFFDEIARIGVISVSGNDRLGEWCSDDALKLLNMSREQAHDGSAWVQAGKIYAVDSKHGWALHSSRAGGRS